MNEKNLISRRQFQNLSREEAMELAKKTIGNTTTVRMKKVVGVDFSYGTFLKDLKYFYGIEKQSRVSAFNYMDNEKWNRYKKKQKEENEKKQIEKEKEVYIFNLGSKSSKAQFSVNDEVLKRFREKHPASKGKKEQLILISVALEYFLNHEDEIEIKIKME